jgi:hypothetical protein
MTVLLEKNEKLTSGMNSIENHLSWGMAKYEFIHPKEKAFSQSGDLI